MDLSKPLPPRPLAYPNGLSSSRRPTRLPPQPSFNQPQYRLSASLESLDAGMVEDTPCRSSSETTVQDCRILEIELWDSCFWSQNEDNLRSSSHQVDPKANVPIRVPGANLSPYNRNFASSNLSRLNSNRCPVEPHRSNVIRTPCPMPKSLSHNAYSPFPAISSPPICKPAHRPWPLCPNSQPRSSPLRSRTHTTPADYKALPPYNLSTCSTLDDSYWPHSSTSASALYMPSSPMPPDFAPPLMDLMEKSCFEDDSSDEKSQFSSLASRLHIRSDNSNSPGLRGKKEKFLRSLKSRKNLKSAGDAFRGMFGLQKSTGVV